MVFIRDPVDGVPRWSRDPKEYSFPRKVEQFRIQHALASAAIPLVFPFCRIDGESSTVMAVYVKMFPAVSGASSGRKTNDCGQSSLPSERSRRFLDRPNPRAKMPSPIFPCGKSAQCFCSIVK